VIAILAGSMLAKEWRMASDLPCLVASAAPQVEVESDEEFPIVIQLTNNSDKPVKIVGDTGHCGHGVCLVTRTRIPMIISPHQSGSIEVAVRGMQEGTFKKDYSIFTDCPGQFRVSVTIQCTVRGGKRAAIE
jgi:hypothetical protein